ncbi:hypothetical protein PPGU19_070950 (plasmid) [Paraburkholderia sp. PGU19]|uniref:hypothetical protein n=1 Tax=Paraburkholderia sp. PGU19 TaxID=2735434 RepID=UPI0015DACD96|nr:hypothetical protein [Paraburkholderia sp. PGU19]BCG02527.1 hypothetical protein PPGU19_070950 [Paraburkholderia sp. PGU19]
MSFDYAPARRVTLGVQHGAIGLDFNVDHLAVTETNPFGNLPRTKRFRLRVKMPRRASVKRCCPMRSAPTIGIGYAIGR